MTAPIRLQYRLANAAWQDCYQGAESTWTPTGPVRQIIDRTDEFLARAAAFSGQTPEQVRALVAAGHSVRFGTDWNNEIRCGIVADARRAALDAREASQASQRFTCRRCGEHRDTTIRGRCDDCEV